MPGRWVLYDRQFWREALARKDLNWSVTDPILYNEAFMGRARPIPRCNFCLQDDHTEQYCPKNLNRALLNWPPKWSPWATLPGTMHGGTHLSPSFPRQGPLAELCRRFNEGRCRQSRCRYTHPCKECGGPHPAVSCPSTSRQPVLGLHHAPLTFHHSRCRSGPTPTTRT